MVPHETFEEEFVKKFFFFFLNKNKIALECVGVYFYGVLKQKKIKK